MTVDMTAHPHLLAHVPGRGYIPAFQIRYGLICQRSDAIQLDQGRSGRETRINNTGPIQNSTRRLYDPQRRSTVTSKEFACV